jgi:hypothetical protein
MSKKQNITEIIGNTFGRLTPIEEVEPYVCKSGNHRRFKCRCECGNEALVKLYSLKNSETKSCGCYNKEIVSKQKHGLIKTSEYSSWYNMKTRCLNPNSTNYSKWGGRGITICDRWIDSFENFLRDMGNKPSPKHSLDRKDLNGNYEPLNCRWATKEEQMNNMSTNKRITHNNSTKTLSEWSMEINIKYDRLKYLIKRGNSIGDVLAMIK